MLIVVVLNEIEFKERGRRTTKSLQEIETMKPSKSDSVSRESQPDRIIQIRKTHSKVLV